MDPLGRLLIRVLGPRGIWETVYISDVDGARKVKSNAWVAINKNSDPVQKYFIMVGWGGQCPQLKFFQTFVIIRNESSYKDHIRAAACRLI